MLHVDGNLASCLFLVDVTLPVAKRIDIGSLFDIDIQLAMDHHENHRMAYRLCSPLQIGEAIVLKWISLIIWSCALYLTGCVHTLVLPPPPSGPCSAKRQCPSQSTIGLESKIIPIDALFAKPFEWYLLSPDGKKTIHMVSTSTRVKLFLIDTSTKSERLFLDKQADIFEPKWMEDSKHVLLMTHELDSIDKYLKVMDVESGKIRTLYRTTCGFPVGVAVDKNEVIIAYSPCSARRLGNHAYRIKIDSGNKTEYSGPGRMRVAKWYADNHMQLRAVLVGGKTGKYALMVRDDERSPWRRLKIFGKRGSFRVFGFSEDDRSMIVADNDNTNTMRLYSIDLSTSQVTEIFHNPSEEILDVFMKRGKPMAVSTADMSFHWHVLDPSYAEDFEYIANQIGSENFDIVRSVDTSDKWLVFSSTPTKPRTIYIYDKEEKKLKTFLKPSDRLVSNDFVETRPVFIKARDGIELPCYLSLPKGRGTFPLVLYVHGGPESRFYYRFNPWVQLLANRGYAVVQVNYRGSLGFGKRLFKAGSDARQGGSIAQDLEDVVQWATSNKDIDTSRVAVFGFSYGGFSTLLALSVNPELYAAGVDAFGPSDLVRIGNLFVRAGTSLKDRRELVFSGKRKKAEGNSPLNFVEKIQAPLLVAHSRFDRNVPEEHSDELVAAMRNAGKCVQYVFYPDEAHGFELPENAMDFAKRLEDFLAHHLCGRRQKGEFVPNSSAKVK